jgi:hypothetical protein
LDEEICPNAMKSQIIDDRGGTIFVKAIDTSSADELNMLPKFKIDISKLIFCNFLKKTFRS